MRISHLAGASALALTVSAFCGTAFAAATAAPDTNDIVVTATRESTRLSKTPVAVTAITGSGLRDAGIVNPTNLGERVPNLSIDRTNGLQITIRGVTSTDGTEKGDPSAAFLLDGIYLARPQEADVSFMDVNHVEVLRGPQGTRFGKNTTAGVVNVITNKPEFGKVSAGANVGYGNYSALNADAFVNYGFGTASALRIAGSFDEKDSPTKQAAGDPLSLNPFRRNESVRVSFRQGLGDKGEALIRFSYAHLDGTRANAAPTSHFFQENAAGTSPVLDANHNAIWSPISGDVSTLLTRNLMQVPVAADQYGFGARGHVGQWVNDSTLGIDGELNYQFGPIKATYLGSYRTYHAHENGELDIYGLAAFNSACAAGQACSYAGAFDGDYKQTSQEIRLATDADKRLQLTAGGYYFREESQIGFYIIDFPQFIIGPNSLYGFPQHTISKTLAGYAEAKFKPTNGIRLTAGVRYTHDDKFRYGHTVRLTSLAEQVVVPDNAYANDAEVKGNKATFRVGFDADVANGLLYGSVATGYKQGGFGDGCSNGYTTLVTSAGERCNAAKGDPQAIYYRPETLTAYELGYRGAIMPGVHVDTNVFYYDYKDMQLSSQLNINGAPTLVTTNAGKARVLGLELETVINPVRNNQLTLGLDLTDAHYSVFCPGGFNAAGVCQFDMAGKKLDRSPSTVFYASYDFTAPLANGATVVANVGTRVTSRYAITQFGVAPVQYFTPSHTNTSVSLTYHAQGGHWYIQAFAKNLENFIEIRNVTSDTVTPGDPRTFGVRAGIKF